MVHEYIYRFFRYYNFLEGLGHIHTNTCSEYVCFDFYGILFFKARVRKTYKNKTETIRMNELKRDVAVFFDEEMLTIILKHLPDKNMTHKEQQLREYLQKAGNNIFGW